MKCPFCISFLMSCAIWLAACTGPVLIDEPAEDSTHTEQSGNTPPDGTSQTQEPVAIIHEGTYTSPYSIAEAQALKSAKSVWIEGYIVGTISGSMKSGCNYTAESTIASNILLADTFPTGDENDHLRCLPVELPNNSTERDELNLYDNPDNYHRKVRLQGDITLYYKVVGMKEIADYIFWDEYEDENRDEDKNEGKNENEDDNDNQDEDNNGPSDPDITRQDTLSISEGIKLQNKGEQPYIRGYIVGYYNGSSPIFNPSPEQMQSSRASNNVILADHIEETDWHNVIIVDLPTKTALRSNVNLKDNPQNLHRRLTVKGTLREYKDNTGYYGCMETLSKLDDDEDYYFSIE